MANLPREIIFDILTRLPAKSLLRFRCVCKSWLSLLSDDPQFVKTHLHRAITDADVGCRRVLLSTYSYVQSIDFEALTNGDNNNNPSSSSSMALDFLTRATEHEHEIVGSVLVAGSCNGLVFLVVNFNRIIVCNPCTRKFRELLPKPSLPSSGFLVHGFGYDSFVDDYKVVRAARPASSNSSGNTQMEVFSLKTNSWKRVNDIHPSISLNMGQGAFLDDSLHWIATCRHSLDHRKIVSFSLATEELSELVPLPPDLGDWNYLILLGGCLSVVCSHGHDKFSEIWMMKEYGVEASWTKLFIYREHHNYVLPLCLSKNGEVLLDVDGKKLIMYNLEKMATRHLDVQGQWLYSLSATYVETLVSPNGNQA